ncbi:MAG: hypothetical protein KAS32_14685 [Candidatus Peribacteraceae bacterium]|nr:hypothetical protein [Candidatus Peribacteraceae bacterium]
MTKGKKCGGGSCFNVLFSDSMNSNNPTYQTSQDKRVKQLTPNNSEYKDDEEED